MELSNYQLKGYADRAAYLRSVAEDYDVPLYQVLAIADLLGPSEDFDGLLVEVDDLSNLEA